jgi:hypothetical protein
MTKGPIKKSDAVVVMGDVEPKLDLPPVATSDMLDKLTEALGVDRGVVALEPQIQHAWSQLPKLIRRIPPKLRDAKIVKACIAVACGLFDAAINYIWNAAIVELREKVRRFGLHVIPQILDDKMFDEESLVDLKDAELLDLCLKLNLISDQDFFFLDQCRATRNSYSIAHPAEGLVDEDEFIGFLSRCQKHALSSAHNPKGVDTKALLSALKAARFKKDQIEEWERRIQATFDVQRELIFGMLHGIYCDPDSGEEARVNALSICKSFAGELSPKTRSVLVDRHQDYRAKGDDKRYLASQGFFESLGLLSLLSEAEIHSLITSASRNLLRVHRDWNNFYDEPPFAQRLAQLTRDNRVPESAQTDFVSAVVTAATGNGYGVSHGAEPYYWAMVKSFSPNEIKIMLELPKDGSTLSARIKGSVDCESRFRQLVNLLDESSIPTSAKSSYRKWLPKKR